MLSKRIIELIAFKRISIGEFKSVLTATFFFNLGLTESDNDTYANEELT